MLNDNFGAYEVTFNYLEPTNNKHYEMRKYVNSKKIKSLGGMYAIYCEEDNSIIFRRSEYLRDRSYSKLVDGTCEDARNADSSIGTLVCKSIPSNYSCTKTVRYVSNDTSKTYNLPSHIDKTKLTEEEFNELRRLIKKSLPND